MGIVGIVIIVAIGIACVIALYYYLRVKIGGLETDAVVSRIEESEMTDSNDTPSVVRTYYVRYQTQDGRNVESVLSNPTRVSDFLKNKEALSVGTRIRVKYLPNAESFVIWVGKN